MKDLKYWVNGEDVDSFPRFVTVMCQINRFNHLIPSFLLLFPHSSLNGFLYTS